MVRGGIGFWGIWFITIGGCSLDFGRVDFIKLEGAVQKWQIQLVSEPLT